jgi:hypothetical protein
MPRAAYSDDEVEEIIDMRAPDNKFSMREIRATIQDNPLLVTGLLFSFGLLVGFAFGKRRRSR